MKQNKRHDALARYARLAFSELNKETEWQRSILPHVITDGNEALRQKAKEIEQHEAFYELVKETRSAYGNGYHEYGEDKLKSHQEIWAGALRNFFRRSGFYLNCFDGISYDIEELFNLYCMSFSKKKVKITNLAPIGTVELDFGERVLQFDDFTIKQLSAEDKNEWIAKNRVNTVFYPGAAIDIEDAFDRRLIAEYSFLKHVEVSPIPQLVKDNDVFYWKGMEQHQVVFSNHSEIENALKRMVLFDWESQFFESGIGFDIPVIFKFDDNLIGYPSFAPDLSVLTTETYVWADSRLDEEIERERVPFLFHHTPEETLALRLFLETTGSALASLKNKRRGWEFIEVALGFLVKGFFSKGFAQLLWHITVIESLLGEKSEGLAQKLSERLSRIWGETSTGICFKKLYDYRCDLVHGNREVLSHTIHEDQLKEARVLARGTLCWFINYLACLLDSNMYPKRSNVLKIIDDVASTNQNVANILPEDFPQVRAWLCIRKGCV